jgi:hypothetical protein
VKVANCEQPSEEMSTTTPPDVIQVPKSSKNKMKIAAKAKRAEMRTFPWKNSDDFNIVQLVLPVKISCYATSSGNDAEPTVHAIKTLPYVIGVIKGKAERLHIDTGSCLSLIDSKVYPDEPTTNAQNVKLFSASNHEIEILGKIDLQVELGKLIFPCEFIVIKNLAAKFLMGNSTFTRHNLNLNYKDRSCEFEYNGEKSGQLALKSNDSVSLIESTQ